MIKIAWTLATMYSTFKPGTQAVSTEHFNVQMFRPEPEKPLFSKHT